MGPRFSLVYPTRHRPEFIRQALRILEMQRSGSFEVVVCDNYLDPAYSCEQICRDSGLLNLTYVRPPQPLGMVENWSHALGFVTGEYVCYLTDKMLLLPHALSHIEGALDAAGSPEIVSWTSDAYNPDSYPDYFGPGQYVDMSTGGRPGTYHPFSPAEELDRRGRAAVSRPEQRVADYCRGKLAFGGYRRDLVDRIVDRYGALFHNISPDYTSLVLGLTEARHAIELSTSCVVSVNTDISNGMLSDTSDAAALGFLESLSGGAEHILPNLLVPGLYASLHNWVAHDFLTLRAAFRLQFEIDTTNWLVYCREDIYRPSRRWSATRVEAEQKALLEAFIESLDPPTALAVRARVAERAKRKLEPRSPRDLLRDPWRRLAPRSARRLLRGTWQRLVPPRSVAAASLQAALEDRVRR